jgi:hypothetical protein
LLCASARAGTEEASDPDALVGVEVAAHVFHIHGQPIGDFRKTWRAACVAAGLGNLVPTGEITLTEKPKLRYAD